MYMFLDNITLEDLNRISPFGNTADIIEIKGRVLKKAFEHGVGGVEGLKGRFPQVSGKLLTFKDTKCRGP